MIDIKKKGHQKKILMAVQQLSDLELTAILDEVVAGRFLFYLSGYLQILPLIDWKLHHWNSDWFT